MAGKGFNKVLSVILVIVVLLIIGALGFIGYDYVLKRYINTSDAAKEIEEIDKYIKENNPIAVEVPDENNNQDGNNDNNQGNGSTYQGGGAAWCRWKNRITCSWITISNTRDVNRCKCYRCFCCDAIWCRYKPSGKYNYYGT